MPQHGCKMGLAYKGLGLTLELGYDMIMCNRWSTCDLKSQIY